MSMMLRNLRKWRKYEVFYFDICVVIVCKVGIKSVYMNVSVSDCK